MTLFRTVDDLLRGTHTRPESLRKGEIEVDTGRLLTAVLILGMAYGAFMGLYAVLRGGDGSLRQIGAATLKVPLLFVLTLLVTFPSLYVFSALAQSRLTFQMTLRLLLAAIAVNMTLLASFGPVTGFFTLSTESYPFMIVLNVAFFAVAGAVGLTFLRKALAGVFATDESVLSQSSSGQNVFRIWTLIYAAVGAQMGWILRPFIGDPNSPFELFRERRGNFFIAVWEAFWNLF
jgi:hypothetical protein